MLSDYVDADIAVQRGTTRPTGPIHLTTENATLDTDWTTAAGTGSYPGKLLVSSRLVQQVTMFMYSKYYHVSYCLLQVLLWLHC